MRKSWMYALVVAAVLVNCSAASAKRSVSISEALYKITRASGTLTVNFASDPATCAASGRCGINGTETYTAALLPHDESLALLALGRAGRTRIISGEILIASGSSSASVNLPSGGAPCADQIGDVALGLGLTDGGAHRLSVVLAAPGLSTETPGAFGVVDPFDNHCPGPRVTDLEPTLGVISISQFGHKTLSLPLNSSSQFTSSGFTGTATTALQIKLRRTKLPRLAQKLLNSLG